MKNKKIIIPIIIILAIAGALSLWYFKFRPQRAVPVVNGPTIDQKKQQDETNAAQKKEAAENNTQTAPVTAPTSDSIKLTATQESNNTVTIITKLTGVSDGSCRLDISNGGETTTQTANVIYQPEYSTCAGFSVPINSVGKGVWNIKLTLTNRGTVASQTTTQEIK